MFRFLLLFYPRTVAMHVHSCSRRSGNCWRWWKVIGCVLSGKFVLFY